MGACLSAKFHPQDVSGWALCFAIEKLDEKRLRFKNKQQNPENSSTYDTTQMQCRTLTSKSIASA